MEGYKRWNVPAFGSWNYSDHLPFTQCFDSVAQAGVILPCGYSSDQDHDLYVAGDLYENNTVTPAVIVVPRRPRGRNPQAKESIKQETELGYETKEPPSPIKHRSSSPLPQPPPKAVDENLYKIPSELIYTKVPKRSKTIPELQSRALLQSPVSKVTEQTYLNIHSNHSKKAMLT
ncbi:hypothetical protein AKJ16_DCAP22888 [Drosera capensis]